MPLLSPRSLLAALSFGSLVACAHRPPPTSAGAAPATAPKEIVSFALGSGAVDVLLREEWRRAGVVPAVRSDDATFLRRAYIDIVGTIPSPDVTTRFLADRAKDKRAKLVDALLASAQYAEHWTNYWDDVLMGDKKLNNLTDRDAFRGWLHAQFASNAAWDRVVTELVSATGQNGLGGRKVRGSSMQLEPSTPSEPAPGDDVTEEVNGAVNWTLRYAQTPEDLGGSASRVFLGVQIQCAQCHDHKTEKWTQEDFRRFSSGFLRAKVEPIDKRPPNGEIKRVVLVDSAAPARFARKGEVLPLVRAKPTALDGTELERGKDTRKALAAWMTAKDNPWFAKAFVNRMWGHFLGRGFYDPVDDLRPSNPPAAPHVLERIAADFAAHDFDVKHVVRTICATEAYQLGTSPAPNPSTDPENELWGRFHLVPLGPEELLNALLRVTDLEKAAEAGGIKDIDALRANIVKQYAFLFDTDEVDDEPDYSGTVSQALALLNGALVRQGGRALPGSMLRELVDGPGTTRDKVDRLVVTVLARHATAEEGDRWTRYVEENDKAAPSAAPAARGKKTGPLERLGSRPADASSPTRAAYEDLLWTLLNSSEFTFNH